MDSNRMLDAIADAFGRENEYFARRVITDFTQDGKFLGDFFQELVFETPADGVPVVYSFASPFDLVTKKAPSQVQVFRDGELLVSRDFSEYVSQRTGAMDALLAQQLALDVGNLRTLYIGGGKTARWSLRCMKNRFGKLSEVDYTSRTMPNEAFEAEAASIGVKAVAVGQPEFGEYDCMFFHTNCAEPILGPEWLGRLKSGGLLTTYISSTENGEIADEFYSADVNVILDWSDNLSHAKDLSRAVNTGLLQVKDLQLLKDVLAGGDVDRSRPTIFRSCGTPMQDLAVIKELMKSE